MKWPLVSTCCYCVPLRKGVLAIGYVNLSFALLCLPLLVVVAVSGPPADSDQTGWNSETAITLTAVDIVLSGILLVGVHKNKRNLLRFYFYAELLYQVVSILLLEAVFVANTPAETGVLVITTALNVYLLFLVYNLIHTVEELSPGMQFTNKNTNLYV